MANYKRPGVSVEETLTAGNVPTVGGSTSVAAFVAVSNRGPTTPTLVTSWSDYLRLFGGYANSTALTDSVFQFFANGGGTCYITRVTDTTAVVATRTLTDRATTPLPTLRIDAINTGAWGNQIYLDIVDAGATGSGRFDVVVKFGGTASTNIVERFADVTMDSTDSRYVVGQINTLSSYIVATNLNSVTAAPGNAPLAQVGTVLASGTDGATPAQADWLRQVNLLGTIDSPLVLNYPGITAGGATNISILTDAINFATASGKIFMVIGSNYGDDVNTVVTNAALLPASSSAALYYPWIQINDPSKFASTATKFVDPSASVVGLFVATDATRGPFKTPAGINARVVGAVDVERRLTDTDLDTLNSATYAVNAIRPVPGGNICVMGGRTLKIGYSDRYVAVRRSLIYLKKALSDATQFAIFEPNDGQLWAAIRRRAEDLLSNYWASGGLKGDDVTQAFYVRCDSTLNTPQVIANGQVFVEVGVALQYPAEFVIIRIGQYEGGSSAQEVI